MSRRAGPAADGIRLVPGGPSRQPTARPMPGDPSRARRVVPPEDGPAARDLARDPVGEPAERGRKDPGPVEGAGVLPSCPIYGSDGLFGLWGEQQKTGTVW
ncbi:hypothetical protein Shyhy02_20750 [Streptomyces hygroscopicus subsp. hygroscopicus]|nr:hypothetical protein Shyhy02_20750 [Streptomyces hygroscopicus subsp. hygroscopicus]